MIEIKITLEHTQENLELLLAAAKAAQPEKKTEKKAVQPEKKSEKKTEPVKEELPVKEQKKISKTDIRKVALALTKAGKEDKIAEIFGEFGATKLSELKEEDFAAIYEKLEAINE